MILRLQLAEILLSRNACCSREEAEIIAELVVEGCVDDDIFSMKDDVIENLMDSLGVEESEANAIFLDLKRSNGYGDEEESEDSEVDSDAMGSSSLDGNDDEVEEDDAEYLTDGECELCDRYIKLTRHHLIPKSTWPKMHARLMQAATAEENGDRERARLILGDGLEYLLGDRADYGGLVLSNDKAIVRAILHSTIDICRQCHNVVHKTHSNIELAMKYNSVENLLADAQISKFCKWASKQKPGRYKLN